MNLKERCELSLHMLALCIVATFAFLLALAFTPFRPMAQDAPMVDYTEIPQSTAYLRGDGNHGRCLDIILAMWGKSLLAAERGVGDEGNIEGIDLSLFAVAEAAGLRAVQLERSSLRDLEMVNRPCLVRITDESRHLPDYRNLVLAGIGQDDVQLIDPVAAERLVMTRSKFSSLWGGSALVVVQGTPPEDLRGRYATGMTVLRIQNQLQDLGFLHERADGVYGPRTRAAVAAFQERWSLTTDGSAGTVTQLALADFYAPRDEPRLIRSREKAAFLQARLSALDTADDLETAGLVLGLVEASLPDSPSTSDLADLAAAADRVHRYQAFKSAFNACVQHCRAGGSGADECFSRAEELARQVPYAAGIDRAREAATACSPHALFDEAQHILFPLEKAGAEESFYRILQQAVASVDRGDTATAARLLRSSQPRERWNVITTRKMLMALAHDDLGAFRQASREALEQRPAAPDTSFYSTYSRARDALRRGDLRQSAELFETAFHAAVHQGRFVDASACERVLGLIYSTLGEYEQAADHYGGKISYLRRSVREIPQLRSTLADMLRDLGALHARSGKPDEALASLREALDLYGNMGNHRSAGGAALLIANILMDQSDVGGAAANLEAARQHFARVDEPSGIASVLIAQARLNVMRDDYAGALTDLQESLNLTTSRRLKRLEARSWEGRGRVLALLNSLPDARDAFLNAHRLDAVFGDQREIASDANNLGLLSYRSGQSIEGKNADGWLAEALELNQRAGNPAGVAANLANLGHLHLARGELAEARSAFERSLAAAAQSADLMRQFFARSGLGLCLLRSDQPDSALPHMQEALLLAEGSGRADLVWQAYAVWADLLAARGNARAAILFGKRAVNTIQAMRARLAAMTEDYQDSYLVDKGFVYRDLASRLIDQGRLPEAQQVLAMLKREEYSDFLRRDAQAGTAGADSAAYSAQEATRNEQYLALQARLTALAKELEALDRRTAADLDAAERERRAEIRDVLRDARRAFHAYLGELVQGAMDLPADRAMQIAQMNLDKLDALRSTLRGIGADVVLVQYLIMPERLHIILTTPRVTVKREAAVRSVELGRLVFEFRQQLQNPDSAPREKAVQLYDLLVRPLEADLEGYGARTLLVSLDGALRYLPLAALHDGRIYLVERYRTVVLAEAGKYRLAAAPALNWRLAALGNSHSVEGMSSLPSVRAELEGIVRRDASDPDGVLPGVIYLDAAFTRDAFLTSLEQDYPVVHLASHFVLSPGTEENSFLVLGDGQRLTLRDIREEGIDFGRVDLLTLSACNTAVGALGSDGREIEGFAALAQNQGAKTVMATLWPVADESTADFMHGFYGLRSPGGAPIDKAEALAQLQIAFIRGQAPTTSASEEVAGGASYTHPFYWAPFVLIGSPR